MALRKCYGYSTAAIKCIYNSNINEDPGMSDDTALQSSHLPCEVPTLLPHIQMIFLNVYDFGTVIPETDFDSDYDQNNDECNILNRDDSDDNIPLAQRLVAL